jgi:ABC-type sugar transport system ATPase subunit
MGSGRSELVTGIFGAFPKDSSGEVYIKGKKLKIKSPSDAIKNGIGLLTEDRKRFGLIFSLTVGENLTLSILEKISRLFFINKKKEVEIINKFIEKLRIKTKSHKENVSNLSGGTQQKVLVSKSLATEPIVLFLDEPTRGIDIGAKVEIYNIINQLLKEGIAIVMISSELPELLGMSDRILVMREGEIAGEFEREEATQEKIMEFATGVRKNYEFSSVYER